MKNRNISIERRKYLKNKRLEQIAVFLTQMLILVGFLTIWEILARTNIIDGFITSQPSRIFETFTNLSSNNLLMHIKVLKQS